MSAAEKMALRTVLTRWDDLVEEWNLDPYERATLVGGFGDGDIADVATYEIIIGEMRMRLCVELAPVLRRRLGGEVMVRAWLRRANCNLGDRTPLYVMARSPEWMRWLIDTLEARHGG